MRYLMVQYLGKAEPRADNIRPRSGRVWPNTGSVIRIPEDEAFAYLAYPMVWKLAQAHSVDHEDIEKLNRAENVDLVIGLVGMMSKENVLRIMDEAKGFLLTAPEAPVGVDMTDPQACASHDKRIQTIANTLRMMPKSATTLDSRTGAPKLTAVREMCSIKDITKRELEQALVLTSKAA
jgi:hypothetical protein